MSNQKIDGSPQGNKRIEIKPFSEIKETILKDPPSEDVDTSEARYQENLQSARKELQQIERQKEQMMEKARAKVAREQKEWEQTKENLTKQAHDEGYEAGFETGKQSGMDQYQNLLRQANQIVQAANDDYYSNIEQSETAIVDLAMHTAHKIIDRELQEDPSSMLSIVRKAIREIKDHATITIHVHPDYYEIVLQQKEELIRLVHGDTVLTVYADGELDARGCVIEHPFGEIDASIDTQLEQLREVLHDIAMESEP